MADCVLLVHPVRVGEDDNVAFQQGEHVVEHEVLAAIRAEGVENDATVRKSARDLLGPVLGSVRRDDDLEEFARVVQQKRVLELAGDDLFLVVGGDHERGRRRLAAARLFRHEGVTTSTPPRKPREREGIADVLVGEDGDRGPEKEESEHDVFRRAAQATRAAPGGSLAAGSGTSTPTRANSSR